MKVLVIVLLVLSGCSTVPAKKLYKNCDPAGSNLYYCEEIPKNEIGVNK